MFVWLELDRPLGTADQLIGTDGKDHWDDR